MHSISSKGILKKLGFKADIADSGEAAIDSIKETRYDLIFMDIEMPGMNGLETTQQIRLMGEEEGQQYTWLKDLPIIAMTAHTGSRKGKRSKK